MLHSIRACLVVVVLCGSGLHDLTRAAADEVVVRGKTLNNGKEVSVDQIYIYGCDNNSGSVIPKGDKPDGKGGYTLKLENPPGQFTIFGSAKIDGDIKFAQSSPQTSESVKNNSIDLTFLTAEKYTHTFNIKDLKNHISNILQTLPKEDVNRKDLQKILDTK